MDRAGSATVQSRFSARVQGQCVTAQLVRARFVLTGRRSTPSLRLHVPQTERDAEIFIETLGRFRMLRAGTPVPPNAWQSRKARNVLKILVARSGRLTPRDVLAETLWPGADPDVSANRLSVALSTLRTVLDPERRHAADHFLQGSSAIRLSSAIRIDVDQFVRDATQGLRLFRDGRGTESGRLLRTADARYDGDFLPEDIYEDWAVSRREEARALCVDVLTSLAGLALAIGERDDAITYYRRAAERDPYDEANCGLIRALADAGHHGEARRAHARYCKRLAEIGVDPSPIHALSPP